MPTILYPQNTVMYSDISLKEAFLNFYQTNSNFILQTTDDDSYPRSVDLTFDTVTESVNSNIYTEDIPDDELDNDYYLIFGEAEDTNIIKGKITLTWVFDKLITDEWTNAVTNGFSDSKLKYIAYRDYT